MYQTADEGTPYTLVLTFTDAGAADTHTAVIDWNDGNPPEAVAVSPIRGGGTVRATHTYRDNGTHTAVVSVEDDDRGITFAPVPLTVRNVGPAISPSDLTLSAATLREGETLRLTGRFRDPGVLDSHKVCIDWGDGSPASVLDLNPAALDFVFEHRYAEESPTGVPFPIRVTIEDKDRGTGVAATAVTVVDAALSVLSAASVSAIRYNPTGVMTLATFRDEGGAERARRPPRRLPLPTAP